MGLGAGSSQDGVPVKEENPKPQGWVQQVSELNSAYKAMSRVLLDGTMVASKLDAGDAAMKIKWAEMHGMLETLNTFIGEVRNTVSKAAACTSDTGYDEEVQHHMTNLLEQSGVHLYGYKEAYKRMKPYLVSSQG